VPLYVLPFVLGSRKSGLKGAGEEMGRCVTHSCTFSFENVAEVLEVRVAPAHDGMAKLEGWDVCPSVYLVGRVHRSRRGTVSLGILHLYILCQPDASRQASGLTAR